MKKIIVVLITLVLFGCNLSNTPSREVEKYLDNFINLSDEVRMDIDSKASVESLSTENKETYKEALIRQYKNMKYEIKDESINKSNAIVKAYVTVFDYFKTDNTSKEYMNNHIEEFNDVNGIFDNERYNSYRLGELLKAKDTTTYEVTFNLNKDSNGNWILENPSRETLEKINGFYTN